VAVLSFGGVTPRIDDSAFIVNNATVLGDVTIGAESSIWFGVVVRGDVHFIRIGARTNIQDNSVVHVTDGTHPTFIEDDVTIGHAAMIHGCHIKSGALIGMQATVLDGAVVGEQSLVGAGSLVPPNFHVPPRTLVTGVPCKVRRALTDDDLAGLQYSSAHYVEVVERYRTNDPQPDGGW